MQELNIKELEQVGGQGVADVPAAEPTTVAGAPEQLMQPLGWCFGAWWQ